MTLLIGSVPYLNAKPQVDWFHSAECDVDINITYAVPSQLAVLLQRGELDVANVSLFEAIRNPSLRIVPGISISAMGAVKSVRLFSKVPIDRIKTVALDTSSLTSNALLRILLKERYGLSPTYHYHQPHILEMLSKYDAGLIIGDLKLFDLEENTFELDLGEEWLKLTGLPFVYACWLANSNSARQDVTDILTRARDWGNAHLDDLVQKWSTKMQLPFERTHDYLVNVMDYRLTKEHCAGALLYQQKCVEHGLVASGPCLAFEL